MNINRKNIAPIGILLLSLVGCSVSSQVSADPEESTNSTPPASKAMNKQEQIEFSKQDLAKFLDVDPSDISVAGEESVTWRSGALGCPKPGMMYTQSLVSGRLIMLKTGGKAYRYHASVNGTPFYCPNNYAESPSPNPGDI